MSSLPAFTSTHPLLGDEYENMLACIRCGLCLTSCPTYVLTLDESEGPRGRVGMARALAEGHLQPTPDLVGHELNCLVCDACTAVCPAGVHMDPLQVALRSALESETKPRAPAVQLVRWLIFGWLFMDLARLRLVVRFVWLYQRFGLRWLARRLGVLRLARLASLERLLPDIPRHFVAPHDEVYPSAGPEATPSALFAGCIMATALADVDRATIRVLQRAGYTLSNPGPQGCCGALHAHTGDVARAMQLARVNIAAFAHTQGPIIVNSAGCGAMLKEYGHYFRDDPAWSARARVFSGRVRDLSETLVDRQLSLTRELRQKVVLQDACHLLHAQRISRQPRDLLRRIPGVALAEIDEAGLCCGSAGVYNVTNPAQSRQLQRRKLDNALVQTPGLIVTTNPGCLLQLRSGLVERDSTVSVKHLAEVLDEASRP